MEANFSSYILLNCFFKNHLHILIFLKTKQKLVIKSEDKLKKSKLLRNTHNMISIYVKERKNIFACLDLENL